MLQISKKINTQILKCTIALSVFKTKILCRKRSAERSAESQM